MCRRGSPNIAPDNPSRVTLASGVGGMAQLNLGRRKAAGVGSFRPPYLLSPCRGRTLPWARNRRRNCRWAQLRCRLGESGPVQMEGRKRA